MRRVRKLAVSLVLAVFCAAPGAVAQTTIPRASDTLGRVPGAPEPEPVTAEMRWPCAVQGVAAFQGRVHIRCARHRATAPGAVAAPSRPHPVDPEIVFYATENTTAANALAPTAMTLATQAMASGRPLTIVYRSSTAENPAGCLARDCRRFVAVLID